jgi:hypothetical protein
MRNSPWIKCATNAVVSYWQRLIGNWKKLERAQAILTQAGTHGTRRNQCGLFHFMKGTQDRESCTTTSHQVGERFSRPTVIELLSPESDGQQLGVSSTGQSAPSIRLHGCAGFPGMCTPLPIRQAGGDLLYPLVCIQPCNSRLPIVVEVPTISETCLPIPYLSWQYRRPDSCLGTQGKNREGPRRNCFWLPDALQTLGPLFELYEIRSPL